jgi:hypothetical protein
MSEKTAKKPTKKAAAGREDRLKAALKANMARRKAQVKARAQVGEQTVSDPEPGAD